MSKTRNISIFYDCDLTGIKFGNWTVKIVCSVLSPLCLIPMESWDPDKTSNIVHNGGQEWPRTANSPLNQSFVISFYHILQVFHCFWRTIICLAESFHLDPLSVIHHWKGIVKSNLGSHTYMGNPQTIFWGTGILSSHVSESLMWSDTLYYSSFWIFET